MASSPITTWQIDGETVEMVADLIFLGSKITADGDCSHEIKRCLLRGRTVMTNLDSILKSRDITLPTKVHLVKAMVFPVVTYGCESWTVKKAEWGRIDAVERIDLLEKTLESPLHCKEIQPVHPKGNQSWMLIGRTDAEAETPILRPPDVENWLTGKDPDAGKDWRWEEKGTTEDEMVGWHHWLNGPEFEWTPGVGDGQGGLACCGSWGRKESETTEWLNWTEQGWHRVKSNRALAVEGGEGGTNGESSVETYTLTYVKQWEFSVWPGRSSDKLEGWDGVGGGRACPEGGDLCTMADQYWCMQTASWKEAFPEPDPHLRLPAPRAAREPLPLFISQPWWFVRAAHTEAGVIGGG